MLIHFDPIVTHPNHAKYPNNPLMHYVEVICLYETGHYLAVTEQAEQFLNLIGKDPFYNRRQYC